MNNQNFRTIKNEYDKNALKNTFIPASDVPDLHALRLDSNRLIDFGQSFVNLRFLLMLNISSNGISSFDYAQIPLGLQWLDLHSNKIDKLNNFYYSPSAQQQFSLNDINQPAGSTIGQQWQSMLRLTTLDASHNLIREIDNTSLPESLETVQLNNNQIRSIASHTFSTKSNLTRINLSNNQLSSMPFDSLKLSGNRDMQATQLSLIMTNGQKLVDVYLANNPFVCNCNMGWLSQLLLASSSIQSANGLGNNPAGVLLREHQLIMARQLPRIADAHSVNCHLPFARQSPYTGNPNQWSPVMAANQLAIHHSSHHSHTIKQTMRGESSLISRQSELLSSVHLCPYKSHCFALCNCCDFDACDCEMSCPENCSCYYDQTWTTNIVDCSASNQLSSNSQYRSLPQSPHNYKPTPQLVRFTKIPDRIPMDVTDLYLDGLELLHLKGNALIGRRNLKSLYLNNSQIYSIERKAFATQKSMRILQLNSNFLTELNGHEFEEQSELRELYLANNRLISIANTTFGPLKSLQVLHLQNNQLYHFNFWSNLPSEHKLLSLHLGLNPWSCQCDHVEPMLQWLHLNVKHLHDRKSVSCQYNRTHSLHLLTPLIGPEEESSGVYDSLNENYPMFDMRLCLNYTVYPATHSSGVSPSPLPRLPEGSSEQVTNSQTIPSSGREISSDESMLVNSNNNNATSFMPSVFPPPPNDDPFISPERPYGMHPSSIGALPPAQNNAGQGFESVPPHGYQFPPSSSRMNLSSSSLLLGLTSLALVLVILVLSLIHYRRPMGKWFYSHYGLSMFSANKPHDHTIGSMGKHSAMHHHHHHHHHHQYGTSSAGSTSSSSAASTNLSQALCQQQAATNVASGLVTTPLIISNANQHALLNHSSSTSNAATLPYNDEEKLFDAYLTYSKFDEQFVNDYIAPELEYGQSSYR